MFSWVAIDRFAEKERTKDATFRKQSADKVLRSDAQPLTDDDLLAKLRSFGIELAALRWNDFAGRRSRPRRLPRLCSTSAPSTAGKRRCKATGSGFA
jgi:hypothetical protein